MQRHFGQIRTCESLLRWEKVAAEDPTIQKRRYVFTHLLSVSGAEKNLCSFCPLSIFIKRSSLFPGFVGGIIGKGDQMSIPERSKTNQNFIELLFGKKSLSASIRKRNQRAASVLIASFACVLQMHRAKPIPLIPLCIIRRSTNESGFRKYISRSPRNPFVL